MWGSVAGRQEEGKTGEHRSGWHYGRGIQAQNREAKQKSKPLGKKPKDKTFHETL